MAIFKLSAFADEYSAAFDEQIQGLLENGIHLLEPRGVDGINISDITSEKAMEMRSKLDAAGIGISAIGSPIGKVEINSDFEAHKMKLRRTCEIARILGATRIRMFSFRMPEDCTDYSIYRDQVISQIGEMLDIADEYEMQLCHENEKGIYGDTAVRCKELLDAFDGRLGCVFDPANFLQVQVHPLSDAFMLLQNYITYMHIKDCASDGSMVVAGTGKGCLPEIFAVLNRMVKDEMIVTCEPHLRIFEGLSGLEQGESTKIRNDVFATSAEAFAAAVQGTRMCMPRTAVVL